MISNILSIDIEEIFHIEYFKKSKKKKYEYRSLKNIPFILDLLKEYNIKATFFIVGKIAQKYPEIINIIIKNDHELAFHGWSHIPLWKINQHSFKSELKRFLNLHPKCIGYRAPSFSLNENSKWAIRILKDMSFKYDSSVFPTKTPLYGISKAPMKPYKISTKDLKKENDNGIWEFPLLVHPIMGFKFPTAGGFYLRLLPKIVHHSIKVQNNKGYPAVIYIHSWELDPDTPRLKLNLKHSFITYYNIKKTKKILIDLLENFHFISFKEYLDSINNVKN